MQRERSSLPLPHPDHRRKTFPPSRVAVGPRGLTHHRSRVNIHGKVARLLGHNTAGQGGPPCPLCEKGTFERLPSKAGCTHSWIVSKPSMHRWTERMDVWPRRTVSCAGDARTTAAPPDFTTTPWRSVSVCGPAVWSWKKVRGKRSNGVPGPLPARQGQEDLSPIAGSRCAPLISTAGASCTRCAP